MKIFFLASLHGRKKFQAQYQRIVEVTEKLGEEVISDHVLKIREEEVNAWTTEEASKFYNNLLNQIKKTDAVFADLSHPSMSVGYLIATAVSLGKSVVIFISGSEEPHILKPLQESSDRLEVVRYQEVDDLEKLVPQMVTFVRENQNIRFNFFVSPSLSHFLSWVSQKKRVPRSVYLRNLIDQDMEKNSNYLSMSHE